MSSSPLAVNHWSDAACARAFRSQHALPPYQELLGDTVAWLAPRPGERWLDLGCGSGQLSKALWQVSGGRLAEIVGLDCAAANARSYAHLRATLRPTPTLESLRFVAGDFSHGLAAWPDGRFDGIVSGLAVQYAESFDAAAGRWTSAAYDRVLAEVCRLLCPGGRFVFSVNVPEPAWGRVALRSLVESLRHRNPLRYLFKALSMYRYGGWLKREARKGRFHYLPLPTIIDKLTAAGFTGIEHRLSFAGQAFLIRGWKP